METLTWAILCLLLVSSAKSAPQAADIYNLPGTQVRRWQDFPPITNYHAHPPAPEPAIFPPPTVTIRKPPVYSYPTYDTRGYEDFDFNGVQYIPRDTKPMQVVNVTKERMGGFGGTGDTKGYGAFEYKKGNEDEVKEYQDIDAKPIASDAGRYKQQPQTQYYSQQDPSTTNIDDDALYGYPSTNNGPYEFSNANDKSYDYKYLRNEPVNNRDRYQVGKSESDRYGYTDDLYYDDEKNNPQNFKQVDSGFYQTNDQPYGYKIPNTDQPRKYKSGTVKKYKRRGSQKSKKSNKYDDVAPPTKLYQYEDVAPPPTKLYQYEDVVAPPPTKLYQYGRDDVSGDDYYQQKAKNYKNVDEVYQNYQKKEEASKKYKKVDDPFFDFMKDDSDFKMDNDELFGIQERGKLGFDKVDDLSFDAMMEDFFRLPKKKDEKALPRPLI